MSDHVETLRWEGDADGHLVLLDQTRLPAEVVEIDCLSIEDVWRAIKTLTVRGAPAIGCAAAYGVCLSLNDTHRPPLPNDARSCPNPNDAQRRVATQRKEHHEQESHTIARPSLHGTAAFENVLQACDYLATSRPTAVNLSWALDRMRETAKQAATRAPTPIVGRTQEFAEQVLAEAKAIHAEDRQMCEDIGNHGADLLADLPLGSGILTHCNAGALATGGDGTALSVIFELARRGRKPHVWVDETRPLLQGSRLTAWELVQRGIDCTLICDSMAAQVMREGRVQAVITGADRIAANGDAANKIGTYSVAALAKAHSILFYVAAPSSTFDHSVATGDGIPIEQRAAAEITQGFGVATAPEGVSVYNPAFDVTPASLIAAIITERGAVRPVDKQHIRDSLRDTDL